MDLLNSKNLKTILKIIVSAGALYFVFTKINLNSVILIYQQSNLLLIIIAILFFTLSKFIAALRLNYFFRSIDLRISSNSNLKLYLLGMFYNLFLPGGIGGDGYKIYFLGRTSEISRKKIFMAVLFDRLSGVLALFCLAVLISIFLDSKISFNYSYYIWILIPVSILTFYFIAKKFIEKIKNIYSKTTFFSFLVQVSQTLCALAILMALGENESIFAYLFVFLISSIIAMFPISVGGVGLRELTFFYGADLLGLNVNTSIALSLMFYLITALVSFFGLYFSIKGIKEERSEE